MCHADREWCFSSCAAVVAQLSAGLLPELNGQMRVMIVNLAFALRAGNATMKWKDDIAEGAHKRDLEKAKQQEKPKL